MWLQKLNGRIEAWERVLAMCTQEQSNITAVVRVRLARILFNLQVRQEDTRLFPGLPLFITTTIC